MRSDESSKLVRRSFDESELIVKKIVNLAERKPTKTKSVENKRNMEIFLATTVAVSAISLGMYKLIRTLSKK